MKNKNNLGNARPNSGMPQKPSGPSFPTAIRKPNNSNQPNASSNLAASNQVVKKPIHVHSNQNNAGIKQTSPASSQVTLRSPNRPTKRKWIILGVLIGGLIVLASAIAIPLSLTSKKTTVTSELLEVDKVTEFIKVNSEITNKATLQAWLADSNNEAEMRNWFKESIEVDKFSYEVIGDAPLSLRLTATLTGSNEDVTETITGLTINGPVDWDHDEVLEQVSLIQGINSLEALKAWFTDVANQATIASWFTNNTNATYAITVEGTSEISLIPEVKMKQGFVNTANPTTISELTVVNIDWNQETVQAAIKANTSINNLVSLQTWLSASGNATTINSWFTNSGNAQSISVTASGSGPFVLTPAVVAKENTINLSTPVAIEDLIIASAINWQQSNVVEEIALIPGLDSVDALRSWFNDTDNQPEIASWFSNGQNGQNYSIAVQGTTSINLIPTLDTKPGFENRVTPTTISNLRVVTIDWNQNEAQASIAANPAITNLQTLNEWLEDSNNEPEIRTWFTNTDNINEISVQASGNGPFTLTPTVIPVPGSINFSNLTSISNISITSDINWNPEIVIADLRDNPEITDHVTLAQWFENSENQAEINLWFSNHENANISVDVTGNGPFAITPTVEPKPGFINSVTPTPINEFTFTKDVEWIRSTVQKTFELLEGPEKGLNQIRAWVQSPSNQEEMKTWFTNPEYIESVSMEVDNGTPDGGRVTYIFTPTIVMKPGFDFAVPLQPLDDIDNGNARTFGFAAESVFEAETQKLLVAAAGTADLQARINQALADPATKRAMIDTLVTSEYKYLIGDLSINVVEETEELGTNRLYDLTYTFVKQYNHTVPLNSLVHDFNVPISFEVNLTNAYVSEAEQEIALNNLNRNWEDYKTAIDAPETIALTEAENRQLVNEMIADERKREYLEVALLTIKYLPNQGPNEFQCQIQFWSIIDGIEEGGSPTSFTVFPTLE